MTTQFAISNDGTRIAYETIGTGPALVLVDGAMCSREFGPCRSLAEHLQDRFTVTFYDRRGRSESGNTYPYSPEREYEDLAAVITAAGGDAFVLGFSSGGALALQAAASGIRMKKLASYEAPYIGINSNKGKPLSYLADLTAKLEKDDREGAVGYFMVDIVGGPKFMPFMLKLMPKVLRQLKTVAPTLLNDVRVMNTFTAPTATLATITVPTLVMGGSKAKPNMVKAVRDVATAVPGSVHKTLQGQTHQVKDEAIAPELIAFFA
jgi:pimeloyl-ACP methyl ester carboxylesterase